MMAQISTAGPFDFGLAFKDTVKFSLFGVFWLGGLIATVLQIAINDGNYYEMINGGQNAVGHLRFWRRAYTCAIITAVAVLVTWRFPQWENHGFFTVASWSSIALPSATVVMCVDQFLLPRLAGVRRAVERIPTWRSAGLANWPAIVAVLAAVLFGAWGLNLFPWHPSTPNLGLVPVESWLIAGVLYTVLAMGAARSGATALLGHSNTPLVTPAADVTEVPDDATEVTDAADSAVEEPVHD